MLATVRERVLDFVDDHLGLLLLLATVVVYFALAGFLMTVGAPTFVIGLLGGLFGSLAVTIVRAWRSTRH